MKTVLEGMAMNLESQRECAVQRRDPESRGQVVGKSAWVRFFMLTLYALAILTGGSSQAFAQLNQGSYPDWASRWPEKEPYDQECGPLWNRLQYGPFNYQLAGPSDRELVEGAHFSIEYAAYQRGLKIAPRYGAAGPPAKGFSYTLWAFPNHPQALAAMEDLGFKEKTDLPVGARLRVHCYFQRAVRFAPEDAEVRAVYGYYFARRGKANEAKVQFEKAEELDQNKTNIAVYRAFGYLELKDYEKALAAAKQAYASGYPLPGLRHRLERVGAWKD